jgi:hypothetical protein
VVIVLPEALKRPRARDRAGGGSPVGEDERVGAAELAAVAGALGPPVGGGVDHRVAAGLALVGVAKVADPVDHGGRAEPVARRAVRVVLEVNHAR